MADLALIKKLRESTGCGIADCNKALAECGDDFDEAVKWLRKKGLSAAAKKSGRVAAEGVVAIKNAGDRAAIVEINSETDFVARNEKFQQFAQGIAALALESGSSDAEDLKLQSYPQTSHNLAEEITNQIAVIGENLTVRRCAVLEVSEGIIVDYLHNSVARGLGKIGVLIAVKSSADKGKLEEFGRQIAMHIAAAKPEALSRDEVSEEKIAREKEIFSEQARNSGKPENIIEKMVEGRLRKYYEEVVLLEQGFVMDDKVKISDVVKNFEKEVGASISIEGFVLYVLGEGIEKKEDNFAKEVASMTK